MVDSKAFAPIIRAPNTVPAPARVRADFVCADGSGPRRAATDATFRN